MGEVSIASPAPVRPFRSLPGYLLVTLMAVLLVSAVACPRQAADLTVSEVTYLAAGQSLLRDFDLQFGESDVERLKTISLTERDLELRPSSSSENGRYEVNGVYPFLLAPVVWLAPLRGPAIVNALLLVLLVVATTRRLDQQMGRDAYSLVTICLFASVMYRSVFLVQPTLMLATFVAWAFNLVFRHEEPAGHGIRDVYRPHEQGTGSGFSGLTIGVLLGLVALHHPLYLLLAIPAAVAAPTGQWRSRLSGLIGGQVLVIGVGALLWGLWGQSLSGFTAELGQGLSQFDVSLATWNLIYFSVGRNVGVLPYLLPSLALLGLWKGGTHRSALVITAIAGSLVYLLFTPFNFFGGPAAVGNAWLIPWYVSLWFVPTRALPRGWLAATLLLAALAMYPTWLAPSVDPVTPAGAYRHASGRFHLLLPLETTQEKLPPGEVMEGRFFIRSMNFEARVSGSSRWLVEGLEWVEMHLATPTELAAVYLQFGSQAEAQLEIRGAELGDMVLTPEGGVGFRLENLKRKALHPMWWSQETHFNYVLQFKMPMEEARAQTLRITGIAADLELAKP